MKELTVRQYLHNDGSGFTLGYDKSEVDAVITDLKSEIDYEHGVEQRWFERCMEARAENVRLKRALWLARAAMCKLEKERWASHIDLGGRRNRKDPAYVKTGKLLTVTEWRELWANNELKCKSKAEVYK